MFVGCQSGFTCETFIFFHYIYIFLTLQSKKPQTIFRLNHRKQKGRLPLPLGFIFWLVIWSITTVLPSDGILQVFVPTSVLLATRLATISWIIPRLLPSVDMDLRSVSMASWLVLPNSDSPLTAISWSLIRSRPSCQSQPEFSLDMEKKKTPNSADGQSSPSSLSDLSDGLSSECILFLISNRQECFYVHYHGSCQHKLTKKKPSSEDGNRGKGFAQRFLSNTNIY